MGFQIEKSEAVREDLHRNHSKKLPQERGIPLPNRYEGRTPSFLKTVPKVLPDVRAVLDKFLA